MSKQEEIKPGNYVVPTSPLRRNFGPFRVRKVDKDGFLWVERRTAGRGRIGGFDPHRERIIKLEPSSTVKQALIAQVPENQRCQICGYRPGRESHFITISVGPFIRLCSEDKEEAKKQIRKIVEPIVAEVFQRLKNMARKEAASH